MNAVQKRKEILDWVMGVEEGTLELLDQLKESETKDWWDSLSFDQKKMIKEGEEDVTSGRVISHDQVKKLYDL